MGELADGGEALGENKLPNIAEQDAADYVRHEEDGTQHILGLERSHQYEGKDQGQHVGDNNGYNREPQREVQRIPEAIVMENPAPVRGACPHRFVQVETVPIGGGIIESQNERGYHYGQKEKKTRTQEYDLLAPTLASAPLFSYGLHCRRIDPGAEFGFVCNTQRFFHGGSPLYVVSLLHTFIIVTLAYRQHSL
ncbi:hypothetical protein D3C71_1558660 [compost metagenome]